ncbi:murein transglycosylase [Actinoplanes teichomyceticus]|uniref:Membrane-bound lytic murein transglycosylase B n=1 Tax=Actinoplanes teichomyceticus TaxID=1867 RepID=A0A561WPZ0_ACTTI|nr:murein transglycosylase [Actinoplanes teichomyceticus]TWG25928.1 hypothetical protein FHX34_101902 [Actinoplanes teichomyceticus]GIF11003.1 hypothetical protein Ate01nite_10350 [Actinoplanes teichomyceticus]
MAEARKIPAERPELRAAAPQRGRPLGGSGAAAAEEAGKGPTTPAEGPGRGPTTPGKGPGGEPTTPGKEPGSEPTTPGKGAGSGTAAETATPASAAGTDRAGGNERPAAPEPTTAATPATPSGTTGNPGEDTAAGKTAGAATPAATGTTEESGNSAPAGKSADAATPSPTGTTENLGNGAPADKTATSAAPSGTGPAGAPGSGAPGGGAPGGGAATGGATGAGTPGGGGATAVAVPAPPAGRSAVRRWTGWAGRGGRAVAAWAKRPSGRVILPSVVVVVLIGLAGAAGIYLVPRALEAAPTPSATPTFAAGAAAPAPSASGPFGLPTGGFPAAPPATAVVPGATTVVPGYPAAPTTAFGGVPPATTAGAPGAGTGNRPADTLAAWAQTTGTKVGIPVVAVQAYGYAELVTAQTTPSCHLTWTTLAAIGKVASGHGSSNGAVLNVDGAVRPTIIGLPLDGQGGRPLVVDTDRGTLDLDPGFDREVGPMKLIPSTWQASSVDADRNGTPEINDIDDAALAAATALCKGANGGVRDLSKADAWWDAVLNYGALRTSAQKVFEAANDYGARSRT